MFSSKVSPIIYEQASIDLNKISQMCAMRPETAPIFHHLKDLIIEKEIENKVFREQNENKKLNQTKP